MDFNSLIESCYSLYNERQYVLKTLKTQEEFTKWEKDTLHFYRVQIEPYIFNYLNLTYGNKLDNFWKTHQFPKKSKYSFVIVERRVHPNWWFILRNIAWAAPNFSLYIYCSDLNYEFIKTILGDKVDNVHIFKWFQGNPDRKTALQEYNITLKMPQFYKLIESEYVITVQMDSYFLQKIPEWIFCGTYYGAPWAWNPSACGNGGLSIRHINSMIEICEKDIINIQNNTDEDMFFSNMIQKNNYNLPSLEFRLKVFQENYPIDAIPIGIHQFWTFIMNYSLSDKALFTKNIKKLLTLIEL
jgi:hypothetical protein